MQWPDHVNAAANQWNLKRSQTLSICTLNLPAKWLRHTVVTGSHYCCYAPVLHWFCVVIGLIVVQDKRDPVDLVTEDYDINTPLAN